MLLRKNVLKKIFSLFIAVVMIVGVMLASPVSAGAVSNTTNKFASQTTVPEGFTPIYTAKDLDNIRNATDGSYILMNDVDMKDFDSWSAISSFSGTLDGNGYAIKNLNMAKSASATIVISSLFYEIEDATIKNLGFSNIGGTADYPLQWTSFIMFAKNSTITNCYSYNSGAMTISFSDIWLTIIFGEPVIPVGGIVCKATGSTINNCYYSGDLSAKISGQGATFRVGGIVGEASDSDIFDCYNTGTVTFIQSNGANAATVGGIVGEISKTSLSSCYAAKNILEADFITAEGAIAGKIDSESELNHCYYLEDIASNGVGSNSLCSGVTSLTDDQMRSKDSFVGFDFENIWEMPDNGYPVFKDLTADDTPEPEPPVKMKWWEKLSAHRQLILRYFFFGWIWMM